MEKILHANYTQKRGGVAILISDQIDFKSETIIRDKESYCIMIKRLIYKEDVIIINIWITNTWIKALNMRPKAIKLLKENIGEKLHDIGFGNDFLAMTPKSQATKEKLDKLDFIKIKNVLYIK